MLTWFVPAEILPIKPNDFASDGRVRVRRAATNFKRLICVYELLSRRDILFLGWMSFIEQFEERVLILGWHQRRICMAA